MILYEEIFEDYNYDMQEIDNFLDMMIKEMLMYMIFD